MQWNLITGETHENVQLVLFLSLYILIFWGGGGGGGGCCQVIKTWKDCKVQKFGSSKVTKAAYICFQNNNSSILKYFYS